MANELEQIVPLNEDVSTVTPSIEPKQAVPLSEDTPMGEPRGLKASVLPINIAQEKTPSEEDDSISQVEIERRKNEASFLETARVASERASVAWGIKEHLSPSIGRPVSSVSFDEDVEWKDSKEYLEMTSQLTRDPDVINKIGMSGLEIKNISQALKDSTSPADYAWRLARIVQNKQDDKALVDNPITGLVASLVVGMAEGAAVTPPGATTVVGGIGGAALGLARGGRALYTATKVKKVFDTLAEANSVARKINKVTKGSPYRPKLDFIRKSADVANTIYRKSTNTRPASAISSASSNIALELVQEKLNSGLYLDTGERAENLILAGGLGGIFGALAPQAKNVRLFKAKGSPRGDKRNEDGSIDKHSYHDNEIPDHEIETKLQTYTALDAVSDLDPNIDYMAGALKKKAAATKRHENATTKLNEAEASRERLITKLKVDIEAKDPEGGPAPDTLGELEERVTKINERLEAEYNKEVAEFSEAVETVDSITGDIVKPIEPVKKTYKPDIDGIRSTEARIEVHTTAAELSKKDLKGIDETIDRINEGAITPTEEALGALFEDLSIRFTGGKLPHVVLSKKVYDQATTYAEKVDVSPEFKDLLGKLQVKGSEASTVNSPTIHDVSAGGMTEVGETAFLQSISDSLLSAAGPITRNFGRLIGGAPKNTKDGTSMLSLGSHRNVFDNIYKSSVAVSFEEGFRAAKLAGVVESRAQYKSQVREYLIKTEFDEGSKLEFPQSIVGGGDDLTDILTKMGSEVNRTGYGTDSLGTVVKDAGDGKIPRIYNSERLGNLFRGATPEQIVEIENVLLGSMYKAKPEMHVEFLKKDIHKELKRIRSRDFAEPGDIKRVEELEGLLVRLDLEYIKGPKISKGRISSADAKALRDIDVGLGINTTGAVIKRTYISNLQKKVRDPQGLDNRELADAVTVDEVLESIKRDSNLSNDELNSIKQAFITQERRLSRGTGPVDTSKARLAFDASFKERTQLSSGSSDGMFRMADLQVDDVDALMGVAVNQKGLQFGAGKLGYKSTSALLDISKKAREEVRLSTDPESRKKQLLKELDLVDRDLKGEPLFQQGDNNYFKAFNVFRKFSHTLLGRLFMNLNAELGNAEVLIGVDHAAMKALNTQLKGVGRVLSDGDDPSLARQAGQAVSSTAGAVTTHGSGRFFGEDSFTNPNKNYLDNKRGRLESSLDKADAYSSWVSEKMQTTYRASDRRARQVVGSMAMQGFIDIAKSGGLKALKGSDLVRAKDLGIDENFFGKVDELLKSGIIKLDSSGKLIEVDYSALNKSDPRFYDDLQAVLVNEVEMVLMTPRSTNVPLFVHGLLFKVFGQYREHTVTTYSNFVRYNMNYHKMAFARSLVYATAFGGLVYLANQAADGNLGDDSLTDLALASIRRNASLGVFNMVFGDLTNTFLGEDYINKYGSTPVGNTGVTVKMINSVIEALGAVPQLLFTDMPIEEAAETWAKAFAPNLPGIKYAREEIFDD